MSLREVGESLAAWVDAKPLWLPVQPITLHEDDDEQERDAGGLGAAEGQSFMIEYRDARGRMSRRRITVWHLSESSKDGVPFLYARCHERKAMRTFRIDRIATCIDYDGVVHEDVPRFLADCFGMSIGLASASEDAAERQWQLLVSEIKTDATLLSAMSRCDGHTAASEMEAIQGYLVAMIEANGAMLANEDIARLGRHVARLRPTTEAIRRALNAAGEFPPARLKRMMIAAARVMDADAVRHPAEVRLLNIVSQELLGTTLL